MKRIIGFTMALLLVFAISCAAAPLDDFANAPMNSFSMDAKMGVTLNQPLGEAMDPDGSITALLSTFQVGVKGDMIGNDDPLKLQAEMTVDMSQLGQMLGQQVPPMHMWMNMDMSDTDSPVYTMIMEDPESGKYMVMDMAQFMGKEYFEMLANPAEIVPPELGGKVQISEDGKTAAIVISKDEVMALMGTVMDTALNSMSGMMDGLNPEEAAQVAQILNLVKNADLFADDAIVITMEVNGQNQLVAMNMKLNIACNVVELAGQLGVPAEMLAPLTRDNSNIDATLFYDIGFSNINQLTGVAFPELNDDNTISVIGGADQIAVSYNNTPIVFDVAPTMIDDRTLVPVRAIANAFGVTDEDISYVDGKITIQYQDKIIEMTVDSQDAYVNGSLTQLDVPATVINDRTLVPLRFVSESFDKDVQWQPFENGTGGMVVINDK